MVVFYYMHVHCQDDLNSMNRARGVGTTTMNHDHKMMIIYYTTSILMLNPSSWFIILHEFSL